MREQLDALEELAKIDLGYRQLDVEQSEAEERLAELKSNVGRMRDLLDREKAQLTDAESLRRSHQADIEDLGERAARSTQRLNNAKTNREREAAQREVEVLRREREERQSKAQELETVIPQVRDSIGRHEGDFSQLQEALVDEERDVSERLEAIRARRAEQDIGRKQSMAKVRPDLLRKYETIRAKRGTAIAEIANGICRGCNIAIPPQLFARVHALADIFQCPNCQRILVLRPAGTGV